MDWFHFWNQFETEIDKQDISPETNFSYLKEFFTPEGYSRDRSILVSTYGKPTVLANAHIKCITSLPIITGIHPNRVHEFYEKLIVGTQALTQLKLLGNGPNVIQRYLFLLIKT